MPCPIVSSYVLPPPDPIVDVGHSWVNRGIRHPEVTKGPQPQEFSNINIYWLCLNVPHKKRRMLVCLMGVSYARREDEWTSYHGSILDSAVTKKYIL